MKANKSDTQLKHSGVAVKRAGSASAWQPIRTAPQSGVAVLLWWRCCKDPSVGRWSYDGIRDGWRCDGDQCVPKNQHDCTHWMPLPEPPNAELTDGESASHSRPAAGAPPDSLHPVVRRYGPWICKQRPTGDWVVDQIDRETKRVRRYGPYPTEAEAREVYADLVEVSPNAPMSDRPNY